LAHVGNTILDDVKQHVEPCGLRQSKNIKNKRAKNKAVKEH
jgi:hypothetical protein